jgi:polysaccharide export outer membrane protein
MHATLAGRSGATRWLLGHLVASGLLLHAPSLTAQALAPPHNAPAAPVSAVRAGDAVRITVWRKPELSGEFAVTAAGTLAHPLFRSVVVVGVPLETVESRVRDVLKQYEDNPQFVVEPLLRVGVGGEVRLPNLYSMRPETSIGQAVSLAGGPNDLGRKDRVLLMRDGQRIEVDLRATAGFAGTPVRSGDQLVVERQHSIFRDFITPTIVLAGSIAAIINVARYHR